VSYLGHAWCSCVCCPSPNQLVTSVKGTGTFLLYIDGGNHERYADHRLSIDDTASNILRLPTTLSE
jgi:hypothetical protein